MNEEKELLHKFIQHGQLEAIKSLVIEGTDLEAIHRGKTFLHTAIEAGQEEIVQYLVAQGADIEAWYGGHRTPLLWAIECDQFTLAKYLIDKGANIEAQYLGRTPLYWTIAKGCLELMSYLLDKGAKQREDFGALNMAIGARQPEIAKYLIAKGVNLEVGIRCCTPLHATIDLNQIAIAHYLIDSGANLEAPYEAPYRSYEVPYQGRTPLHHTIDENQVEIAQYLIDKGANLEVLYQGLTPLHRAIIKKKWSIATYLIRKGANVNALCGEFTPLTRLISLNLPQEVTQEIIKMIIVANTGTEGKLNPLFKEALRNHPATLSACQALLRESEILSCGIEALALSDLPLQSESNTSMRAISNRCVLPFKLSREIVLQLLGPNYQDTLKEKYAVNLMVLFNKRKELRIQKAQMEQHPLKMNKLASS